MIRMEGYRKISDGYISLTNEDITGGDLEDNLVKEVNHVITNPILDHAEKTRVLEYKVVVYVKRKE